VGLCQELSQDAAFDGELAVSKHYPFLFLPESSQSFVRVDREA